MGTVIQHIIGMWQPGMKDVSKDLRIRAPAFVVEESIKTSGQFEGFHTLRHSIKNRSLPLPPIFRIRWQD
ncbi:MAG: hypothetical protein JWP69_1218 [Flaviaesturariibacter sp.]|nr:hypothetical protein [Flaviaesturariibacter sp.]